MQIIEGKTAAILSLCFRFNPRAHLHKYHPAIVSVPLMIDKKNSMSFVRAASLGHEQIPRNGKYLRSATVIGMLLGVALVALNITTLMRVSKRWNNDDGTRTTLLKGRVMGRAATLLDLESSIRIEEVMSHLNELQRIGSAANGTRAIGTEGFNQSIDFIARYLTANTNYNVTKTFFNVVSDRLARTPIFSSSINGTVTNHTYSNNASLAEFYYIQYTTSTPTPSYTELSVIPNLGCSDADWRQARPSSANRVALVKRGECTFAEKAALASKYNVRALLIYNDGVSPDRMSPIFVTLGQNNTLPALFLSFSLGQRLVNSARNGSTNIRVLIDIKRLYEAGMPSANVCADTPTGDPTQTIVIGSHSDSVPAGPGINDNGRPLFSLSASMHSGSLFWQVVVVQPISVWPSLLLVSFEHPPIPSTSTVFASAGGVPKRSAFSALKITWRKRKTPPSSVNGCKTI